MTIDEKSKALMEWLEANQGEVPPAEVEPEVIEAVYALRPDLAPKPAVDVSMILDKIESGPFADNKNSSDTVQNNLVSLAKARKNNKIWGSLGLFAAAAMVLIVVVPLKDNEAVTRQPSFQQEIPPPEAVEDDQSQLYDQNQLEQEADYEPLPEQTTPAIQGSQDAAPSTVQPEQRQEEPAVSQPTPRAQSRSASDNMEPPPNPAPQYEIDFEGVDLAPSTPSAPSAQSAPLSSETEIIEMDVFDESGAIGELGGEPNYGEEGLSFQGYGSGGGGFGYSSEGGIGSVSTVDNSENTSGRSADSGFSRRGKPQSSRARTEAVAPEQEDVEFVLEDDELMAGSENREEQSQEASTARLSSEELQVIIESIVELIRHEQFSEALNATQTNRPLAVHDNELLKRLWIQESQALTGLGRLDEAAQALIEAEKL